MGAREKDRGRECRTYAGNACTHNCTQTFAHMNMPEQKRAHSNAGLSHAHSHLRSPKHTQETHMRPQGYGEVRERERETEREEKEEK